MHAFGMLSDLSNEYSVWKTRKNSMPCLCYRHLTRRFAMRVTYVLHDHGVRTSAETPHMTLQWHLSIRLSRGEVGESCSVDVDWTVGQSQTQIHLYPVVLSNNCLSHSIWCHRGRPFACLVPVVSPESCTVFTYKSHSQGEKKEGWTSGVNIIMCSSLCK